uniref:Uncharacterized protein n=1 Tax=Rhizophora mucronata TaxID=61149 RepID=A0A2P2PY18_RHIMU
MMITMSISSHLDHLFVVQCSSSCVKFKCIAFFSYVCCCHKLWHCVIFVACYIFSSLTFVVPKSFLFLTLQDSYCCLYQFLMFTFI